MKRDRETSLHETLEGGTKVPIKAWVRGVPVEPEAREQLKRVASLPIVYKWVAAMPDVHVGKGATVGTVIPTERAIIPAAVGVDIGCGMMAVRTTLSASDLPDSLKAVRSAIEKAVPHGRDEWKSPPKAVQEAWARMRPGYREILAGHPAVRGRHENEGAQLGSLGGGNHFIELCLDEAERLWVMLHSGSRGVGNRLGTYFIERAKEEMRAHQANLPDENLAYLREGTRSFEDYVKAVGWAQDYARVNRELMMEAVLGVLKRTRGLPAFQLTGAAVNCHHNYVARETHYGREVYVTRKGAVRAGKGELGIVPGSMGARSYIVRGKGNPESFHSCSHGAGRVLSRSAARKRFTVADHRLATEGIECRKDPDVIDETPAAYKDIERVMAAQSDLVEVVHSLKQIVVMKG